MKINPIKLYGNWDEGWALDKHVISSIFIDTDIYGHERYDTTRSELGELLYNFKYKGKHENLDKIIEIIKPFLDEWHILKTIDIVLPVPSTKARNYQPANEIAYAIAEIYKLHYSDDVLEKVSNIESKNMDRSNKNLDGIIIVKKGANRRHNILLVDDLYSTGGTLQECVKELRKDPLLNKIYVLTITKTR